MTTMFNWYEANQDTIVESYPNSELLTDLFHELFKYPENSFIKLLEDASIGEGYSMLVFSYHLLRDLEYDQISEGVQIYYVGELVKVISYDTYLAILELLAEAYSKIFLHQKEYVTTLIKKVRFTMEKYKVLNRYSGVLNVKMKGEYLCPIEGYWYLPNVESSRKFYKQDEMLPKADTEEGLWHLDVSIINSYFGWLKN